LPEIYIGENVGMDFPIDKSTTFYISLAVYQALEIIGISVYEFAYKRRPITVSFGNDNDLFIWGNNQDGGFDG
jgi:hypothetical protein